MKRPAWMTDEQYQIALKALHKARMEPYAYPHLAEIVQDAVASDMRELAEESQRQIGCRPGAKPVNSAAISKQPVDTARGKARELLLAALRTGRALSTRQLTTAIASEISIVRDALEVMKSAGAIIKIEQRPALYRIAQ